MADERESPFGDPVSVPCRGTEEKGPLPPFPKASRHEAEGTGKAVSPELGPKVGHIMSVTWPLRRRSRRRRLKGLKGGS